MHDVTAQFEFVPTISSSGFRWWCRWRSIGPAGPRGRRRNAGARAFAHAAGRLCARRWPRWRARPPMPRRPSSEARGQPLRRGAAGHSHAGSRRRRAGPPALRTQDDLPASSCSSRPTRNTRCRPSNSMRGRLPQQTVRRDRLQAALQRVAGRVRPAGARGACGRRRGRGRCRGAASSTDLGRRIRVPVAEVLYLKAELKYVHAAHGHAHPRARRLPHRPRAAPRAAVPARAATRSWPDGSMQALERRLVPGRRRRRGRRRAGRCAWGRWANGSRCRAGRCLR